MLPEVEKNLLEMPQVDCPVSHYFGPGVYIREVVMPAGALIVGHRQKERHLNSMVAGRLLVMIDGELRELVAPMVFESGPGRKVAQILETTVWQNIYSTEETDIDVLESRFLDKSEAYIEHESKTLDSAIIERDNLDYIAALSEVGLSEEEAERIAFDDSDMISLPFEFERVATVRDSKIHGKGLFLNWSVDPGTVLMPARIGNNRTIGGRYVNHSASPNCQYIESDGVIYLVSIAPLRGNAGGSPGDELTVDYRQAVNLVRAISCQE